MTDQNFGEPSNRASGDDQQRQRIELECVGSFVAYTQAGDPHTVEIWTRYDAVHDRNRSRVAPGLSVLTTTDGHDVEYVGHGLYRLHDQPEVSLSSSDPNAP